MTFRIQGEKKGLEKETEKELTRKEKKRKPRVCHHVSQEDKVIQEKMTWSAVLDATGSKIVEGSFVGKSRYSRTRIFRK